ncbi:MAG: VCBS repeat-containing protein [Myxococcota bacterium]|jgi:hypothetical protein|nr:VCBS repeat-containing protein [Myxococcota bacterium]
MKHILTALLLATAVCGLHAQAEPLSFKRILDTPYPKHSGSAGGDMVVADFNGDGKKDIIITGLQHTSFVTWLHLQNSKGAFDQPLKTEHGLPALDRGGVVRAADLDKDGDMDVVLYGRGGVAMQTALFAAYLNNGKGVFSKAADLGAVLPSEDFADVPGAWGKAASGPDNQSDVEVKGLYNAMGWSKGVLELFDLTADGLPDIVFAGVKGMESGADDAGQMIQRDWETAGVFINQGGGAFKLLTAAGYPKLPAKPEVEPERCYPGIAKVIRGFSVSGDFNGDGKLDIAMFGQANTGSKANAGTPETQRNGLPIAEVYLGKGKGSFTVLPKHGLPKLIDGAAAAGDLNKDGKLDLIVMGNTGHPKDPAGGRLTRVYLGQGNGTFVEDSRQKYDKIPNSPDWIVPMMSGDIGVGDLDGDGDLDLIMAGNSNDKSLYLYLNDKGVFKQSFLDKMKQGMGTNNLSGSGSSDASSECDVYLGDLDGDGDLDVIVNGRGGAFQLLAFFNKQK